MLLLQLNRQGIMRYPYFQSLFDFDSFVADQTLLLLTSDLSLCLRKLRSSNAGSLMGRGRGSCAHVIGWKWGKYLIVPCWKKCSCHVWGVSKNLYTNVKQSTNKYHAIRKQIPCNPQTNMNHIFSYYVCIGMYLEILLCALLNQIYLGIVSVRICESRNWCCTGETLFYRWNR